MIVCWRMNSHSAASSGPGFVEDRVGDRHLPDVVELGGPDHLVELMGAQPEAPADALGEQGHVVDVVRAARGSAL